MTILTAERLVRLAYKYPSLYNNWYIFASSALTAVNQSQEIGKVLHFALRQQLLKTSVSLDKSLLTDHYLLKLAEDSIDSAAKYNEFYETGINLPDILIPENYHEKLPLPFKFSRGEEMRALQNMIASKIREAILKIAPISGLPKSINALTALQCAMPNRLKPGLKTKRPDVMFPGQLSSSVVMREDVEGARFEEDKSTIFNTIEGPVTASSLNSKAILENTARGSEFWGIIYGKIKSRVRNQLIDAYPDLWQYAYHSVYGSILSYEGILDAKETSFCVLCALIPQDVNPTLKGHLKGALNVGASKEDVQEIRLLSLDICDWSGNVFWKGGKESVARL